jgi:hypothetical protein
VRRPQPGIHRGAKAQLANTRRLDAGATTDAIKGTPMTHQINVTDLTEWLGGEDQWETYASDSDKKFEVYPRRGIYRVTVDGGVKYLGPRKEAAIRVYNGAR